MLNKFRSIIMNKQIVSQYRDIIISELNTTLSNMNCYIGTMGMFIYWNYCIEFAEYE